MKQMISNKQPLKIVAGLKTILVGIIALCFCSAASTPANAKLSVPLTVRESLSSDVTGMSRTAEPVTVGVPLPENSGITNVSQLGLSGVTAGQFRPLAWWPNGNIKWLLTDFQATVAAGGVNTGVALTDGSGSFGGGNLAADSTAITVNTGVATFTIKKANFNVFDSIVVNGQTLVTAGNGGHVEATDGSDVVYSSANDASSTAIIEENGPVKAVIKCTGTLKSAGGARLMDYTLRLYFFKGKSYVKSTVIMRNADKNYNDAVAFKSFSVNIPLSIGASKTATMARKTDDVSRSLTGTAVLQQGISTAFDFGGYQANCYSWNPPAPGTCAGSTFTADTSYVGMNLQAGAESINSFGSTSDWTKGYAALDDSTGAGMSAAIRWMAGFWPSAFTLVDTGEFNTELFGKWNPKTNYLLFGKHETREIIWDFHTSTPNNQAVLYTLQYPLVASASFDYYRTTKSIYGQSEIATPAEEASFFSGLSPTRIGPSLSNPAMSKFYRAWAWPQGSGNNQNDFALTDLTDFLRTGNTGFLLRGEQRARFDAYAGVTHSDNWTTEQIDIKAGSAIAAQSGKDPGTLGTGSDGGINGFPYDMEHAHIMSIPFLYFLTGDEEIKESVLDYGEFMWRTQQGAIGWFKIPYTQGTVQYFRVLSRKVRNIALAYEFSKNIGIPQSTWAAEIVNITNSLLDSRENVPSIGKYNTGRNMNRGYIYADASIVPTQINGVVVDSSNMRTIHSFFHTFIHFDCMDQVYRIIKDTGLSYPRLNDLEDYLSGLSHFFLDEYIQNYDVNDAAGYKIYKWGFYYDYDLDAYHQAANQVYRPDVVPYPASRPAVWLYKQTGNASYLDTAAQSVWNDWSWDNNPSDLRSTSDLYHQELIWAKQNISSVPTWQNIPLTVTDNGGGSYALSWTVPTGATKYQIKYSDKPIVEWLGFDKVARTYQYDPAQYTAFFAAKNITNNPIPDTAGMTQSITLTGLPAVQKFAMKSLVTPPPPSVKPPAPVKGFQKAN